MSEAPEQKNTGKYTLGNLATKLDVQQVINLINFPETINQGCVTQIFMKEMTFFTLSYRLLRFVLEVCSANFLA